MTYLLESELLQSQDTWKRSQIRLTPTLHKAVLDYISEHELSSLNTAFLALINQGLTTSKGNTKHKIIFTEWHPTHLELENSDSFISHNEKVRMACAEYMNEFFDKYPSHNLIKFEFKSRIQKIHKKDQEVLFGIRIWYRYPVGN
ncbi:hypothetical protein [Psychrobacter sp. PAMC 21119]|uniref:hypothetical protein n=1 Tax=Psychrobacter sp. PAMC 21119 TaxID=1112209 RepID=UPI000288E585|nr:hypothetical protein [Psychrobacter sp. PAMC 21119]